MGLNGKEFLCGQPEMVLCIGGLNIRFGSGGAWCYPAYWNQYRALGANVHRSINFIEVKKINYPSEKPDSKFQLEGPCERGFPLQGNIWRQEKENLIYLETIDSSGMMIYYSRESTAWTMEYTSSELLVAAPFDQFLFFLFLAAQHGFLIHASAVIHEGYGFLFPGISGAGKSTLARFFAQSGAIIIDEDRVGLIEKPEGIRMFSLPSYYSEKSLDGLLNAVVFPVHGEETHLAPLGKARGIIQSCASMASHPVFAEMQQDFASLVSSLLSNLNFYELKFALSPFTVGEMMDIIRNCGPTPSNIITVHE